MPISGVAFALLSVLCWGSATVMSKALLGDFHPTSLLMVQLIASVGFLWSVHLFRRPKSLPFKIITKFAWLGLLEPATAYFLGLIGLDAIDASIATLVQATESMMIVFLSVLFFKERPTIRFWLLSFIAMIGLYIAFGLSNGSNMPNQLKGIGLVAAGTFFAANYVVLSNQFASEYDAIYVVTWQQTVALFSVILGFSFQSSETNTISFLSHISHSMWFAALSGVIQYALAFSLYLLAIQRVGGSAAGSFLNLVPLVGLAGSYLFLGELLSPYQILGAGVTLGAVSLISLHKSSE